MPVGEQYRPAPFEQPNESAENITEVSQNTQKELGAKILTQVGFENCQKNIVNSSFDKARETKEKLLGKNNERRSHASYSSLIENLDTRLAHGADVNNIVSHMDHSDIVKNLDTLINHGASIDIDDLVSRLDDDDIDKNRDTLKKYGYEL